MKFTMTRVRMRAQLSRKTVLHAVKEKKHIEYEVMGEMVNYIAKREGRESRVIRCVGKIRRFIKRVTLNVLNGAPAVELYFSSCLLLATLSFFPLPLLLSLNCLLVFNDGFSLPEYRLLASIFPSQVRLRNPVCSKEKSSAFESFKFCFSFVFICYEIYFLLYIYILAPVHY